MVFIFIELPLAEQASKLVFTDLRDVGSRFIISARLYFLAEFLFIIGGNNFNAFEEFTKFLTVFCLLNEGDDALQEPFKSAFCLIKLLLLLLIVAVALNRVDQVLNL